MYLCNFLNKIILEYTRHYVQILRFYANCSKKISTVDIDRRSDRLLL
jgi:hypothetical protein